MALPGRVRAAPAEVELAVGAAMIRLAAPGDPATGIWSIGGTKGGPDLRLRTARDPFGHLPAR
jgi:hypothetical protein